MGHLLLLKCAPLLNTDPYTHINPYTTRVHRLLQDFHLSLKRTARRPKPNPLLGIVLLVGDKADLRALLLKQREPEMWTP
jgi:hypothetical protein